LAGGCGGVGDRDALHDEASDGESSDDEFVQEGVGDDNELPCVDEGADEAAGATEVGKEDEDATGDAPCIRWNVLPGPARNGFNSPPNSSTTSNSAVDSCGSGVFLSLFSGAAMSGGSLL